MMSLHKKEPWHLSRALHLSVWTMQNEANKIHLCASLSEEDSFHSNSYHTHLQINYIFVLCNVVISTFPCKGLLNSLNDALIFLTMNTSELSPRQTRWKQNCFCKMNNLWNLGKLNSINMLRDNLDFLCKSSTTCNALKVCMRNTLISCITFKEKQMRTDHHWEKSQKL